MKTKSLLFLLVFAVGALYVWHSYSQHGGVSGFKQGLGIKG